MTCYNGLETKLVWKHRILRVCYVLILSSLLSANFVANNCETAKPFSDNGRYSVAVQQLSQFDRHVLILVKNSWFSLVASCLVLTQDKCLINCLNFYWIQLDILMMLKSVMLLRYLISRASWRWRRENRRTELGILLFNASIELILDKSKI